jgi:hypothetical protein
MAFASVIALSMSDKKKNVRKNVLAAITGYNHHIVSVTKNSMACQG